jgi:predicted DNA-binding transcriptional regulator YafY
VEYWITDNKIYTKYILKPLHVFFEKYNYYLLAWENDDHNKPRVFSLNRLRNLNITGKRFKIPNDFKISDYVNEDAEVSLIGNKIFNFELSFHKDIAKKAIEYVYYHNQSIKLCDNGTVLVTFRSTQLEEVFRWVLSQGYLVKVINPPELVAMIKKEIQKVGKYYL